MPAAKAFLKQFALIALAAVMLLIILPRLEGGTIGNSAWIWVAVIPVLAALAVIITGKKSS